VTRAWCALALAAGLIPAVSAAPARAATCAPATTAGGDWPSYGHDLSNSRTQPDEHHIGTGNVGTVAKRWVFDAVDALGGGVVDSTPVVADGCVFVMSSVTSGAQLFAVNADDGSPVWTSGPMPGGDAALGGAGVGSVAVANGRVFAFVSQPGAPYAVAFDTAGHQLWGGGPLALPNTNDGVVERHENAFINASPVVIPSPDGDMVFAGFATEENVAQGGRGGWTIFDAATGAVLAHDHSINDDEMATGAYGASLWATAAADPAGGFVYAATGNPSSAKPEARNADSLIKIDVGRASPTFGHLVGVYHGIPESYVGALRNQPACDDAPDAYKVVGSWSVTCVQLDLDFGASPNLFRNGTGPLMVGDLQKAGVYHAAYTDTMGGAWTSVMGAPAFPLNGASMASDGVGSVFGVSTPGGLMQSLSTVDGRQRWVEPAPDGLHYQSTSVANGVVYCTDDGGFLNAWDATTGLPLLRHNLALDTGEQETTASSSAGVAIARNHLFVASGTHIVAYEVAA